VLALPVCLHEALAREVEARFALPAAISSRRWHEDELEYPELTCPVPAGFAT
jgi:hypothetical protein